MSKLKLNSTTVENSLNRLNEFYDAVSKEGHYHDLSLKKQNARLALDHLERILGGNQNDTLECTTCGPDEK